MAILLGIVRPYNTPKWSPTARMPRTPDAFMRAYSLADGRAVPHTLQNVCACDGGGCASAIRHPCYAIYYHIAGITLTDARFARTSATFPRSAPLFLSRALCRLRTDRAFGRFCSWAVLDSLFSSRTHMRPFVFSVYLAEPFAPFFRHTEFVVVAVVCR